ncbi:MAG: CopG family transcriptional regulator [Acidimicrobiia bacterium]
MARKTTIYLSDDLKEAVEREARRRGFSEAEVIRAAIAAATTHPRPHPGLFESEPFAENANQLLSGFGER